jgi:hypothetical protein
MATHAAVRPASVSGLGPLHASAIGRLQSARLLIEQNADLFQAPVNERLA